MWLLFRRRAGASAPLLLSLDPTSFSKILHGYDGVVMTDFFFFLYHKCLRSGFMEILLLSCYFDLIYFLRSLSSEHFFFFCALQLRYRRGGAEGAGVRESHPG